MRIAKFIGGMVVCAIGCWTTLNAIGEIFGWPWARLLAGVAAFIVGSVWAANNSGKDAP